MASDPTLGLAMPPPPAAPSAADVVRQLEGMGFSNELAQQAALSTEGQGLQAALDYLLHHCQTPRTSIADDAQPTARTTEEEELSRAIEMSLTMASPTTTPGRGHPSFGAPVVGRQPSEAEQVEAAIAASLQDQSQPPRPFLSDTDGSIGSETARAIAQVESYQMGEAERDSMLQPLPMPTPPPIRADAAWERDMLQRVAAKAPRPMQIAKAALILRRHAVTARLRVEERHAAADSGSGAASDRAYEKPHTAASAEWPPAPGSEAADKGATTAHERQIMEGTRLLGERLANLGLRRCATPDPARPRPTTPDHARPRPTTPDHARRARSAAGAATPRPRCALSPFISHTASPPRSPPPQRLGGRRRQLPVPGPLAAAVR